MKRKIGTAVLAAVMVLSMTACKTGPQNDNTTTTTTTAATTTTTAGKPIQITVATKPAATVSTTTSSTTSTQAADDRAFGKLMTDGEFPVHGFYTPAALELAESLSYVEFVDEKQLITTDTSPFTDTVIRLPDEEFRFLHESAVIEFKGVLFAAWYSCPEKELQGYTPIHGARSFDGGKTWTEMVRWADDPTEQEMYCAPAFLVENGALYMFVNTMRGFDNINSLELYKWNETTNTFDKQWRRTMNFKMNANPVKLSNGKLVISGRTGEMGKNPLNPALLISDSATANGDWRIVQVDDTQVQAPETSVVEINKILYMFCRNEPGSVGTELSVAEAPLVYVSKDYGETWSQPATHDIPLRAVKLYAGTFSDGRNYVIGNIESSGRTRLAMYVSEPNSCRFTKRIVLYDTKDAPIENTVMCHYPCVYEQNGKVYITVTLNYDNTGLGDDLFQIRGLQCFTAKLTDL